MKKNRSTMSKEQAVELYDDLQRAMNQMIKNTSGADVKASGKAPVARAKVGKAEVNQHLPGESRGEPVDFGDTVPGYGGGGYGGGGSWSTRGIAVTLGAIVAVRLILGVAETAGVTGAKVQDATAVNVAPKPSEPKLTFTRIERDLLMDLDRRRVDLERRATRLEDKGLELAEQEKAIAVKLTQLRELTATLRQARLDGDKHESAQVDQLAKVYGSMNPPEAAVLIEQLDIQIALQLLQRMPEKRMAQILSLIKPERAVLVTRMLSGGMK